MKIRVESLTLRIDALHAFRFQDGLQLARDQLYAICPGILRGSV